LSFTMLLLFISLGLFYHTKFSCGWSYIEPGGTIGWNSKFKTCGKNRQSPIDIIRAISIMKTFPPFRLQNYDKASKKSVGTNTGHTMKVALDENVEAILSGGGLNEKYQALQFHFHWGSNNAQGSEHYIDGNSYPMEMHIVHYNKKYANIKEALKKPLGIAVLGFFMQVTNQNNPEFNCIAKKLNLIKSFGEKTSMSCNIMKIIPKNLNEFYRYEGSLTTPPCTESVVWTIFPEPIQISKWQINQFRILSETTGHKPVMLADNFRRLQPRNKRKIYTTVSSSSRLTFTNNHRCLLNIFYLTCLICIWKLAVV
ncbi:carbonic anhydrase 1-like, partial [Argonauta hians]